jgi:hypothetical protein
MADENSKAVGAGHNIYADRDHEAQGAHYLLHIDRMTAEGLHSKSAIAGELAHRDAEIAALRKDLARMAQWQKKHQARTSGKWENTDEHDAKWWITNAQGWEIRALYAAPQPAPIAPAAYDQTALELCNECGWKALIPGECCLSCERNKPAPLERKPLTGEEIGDLLWRQQLEGVDLVHAVEAAHNIQGAA